MTREDLIKIVSTAKQIPATMRGLAVLAIGQATPQQLAEVETLIATIAADPTNARAAVLAIGAKWNIPPAVLEGVAAQIESASRA